MGDKSLSTSLRLRRLVWVGPLTVLASVAAVMLIRGLAIVVLRPDSKFLPLTIMPPILDTIVAVTWAVLVFALVGRFAPNPIRIYRKIAAGVLLFSFLPDVAVARLHVFGGTWSYALALMALHVTAWAVCVTMLPGLTQATRAQSDSEAEVSHAFRH